MPANYIFYPKEKIRKHVYNTKNEVKSGRFGEYLFRGTKRIIQISYVKMRW